MAVLAVLAALHLPHQHQALVFLAKVIAAAQITPQARTPQAAAAVQVRLGLRRLALFAEMAVLVYLHL
jgi:hypothetical protein